MSIEYHNLETQTLFRDRTDVFVMGHCCKIFWKILHFQASEACRKVKILPNFLHITLPILSADSDFC